MWRVASWVLVLCFAAMPAARAGQAEWSGDEISDKFNELDKKLRALGDLARSDQRTARRFADLEDSIRELRSTVRKLESQLTTVNTTLETLQKEISKLAAASKAEEPSAPTVPGKTPEEPGGPVAQIAGERTSKTGQHITITGTVENVSKRALNFCIVEATFLDARGNVVKTEQGYTDPRIIAPGAKAAFKILTRDDPRIRRHRLELKTE